MDSYISAGNFCCWGPCFWEAIWSLFFSAGGGGGGVVGLYLTASLQWSSQICWPLWLTKSFIEVYNMWFSQMFFLVSVISKQKNTLHTGLKKSSKNPQHVHSFTFRGYHFVSPLKFNIKITFPKGNPESFSSVGWFVKFLCNFHH